MRARVINLWGGPGSGKSTTAAGLFFLMKTRDMKVELVREYAKELTYAGRLGCRSNQFAILAEQDRRIRECANDVDWVITDSPLPVSIVYGQGEFSGDTFEATVMSAFNAYDNVNVLIDRAKTYQPYGRTQSESEARIVDGMMIGTMCRLGIPKHLRLAGTPDAPQIIFNHLEREYAIQNG